MANYAIEVDNYSHMFLGLSVQYSHRKFPAIYQGN